VVSNNCITDTTRYSVRRAGLLFCIGFESNGNRLGSGESWCLEGGGLFQVRLLVEGFAVIVNERGCNAEIQ